MPVYNYPPAKFFDVMRAQNHILAPIAERMGGKAPKCSVIGVDYKNENGVDCSTYAVIARGQNLTDEALVEHIKKDMTSKGFKLSGVHEYVEGEPPRLIYVERNFFEETIRELNRPVPKDMKSALETFGYHPINLEDFA